MRVSLGHLVCRVAFWVVTGSACLGVRAGAQGFGAPVLAVPVASGQPVFVASADVNGDGIPDLIYIETGATPTASATHVLLGDGKGGFRESAKIATAGVSVGLGNLVGHGLQDLTWMSYGTTIYGTGDLVHVAPANGDGTFSAEEIGPPALSSTAQAPVFAFVTVSDIYGTGQLQVMAQDLHNNQLNFYDTLESLFPKGEGYLTPPSNPPLLAGRVAIADLNGDGLLDLVVSGQSGKGVQIFLMQGSQSGHGGLPIDPMTLVMNGGVESLLVADVNGDGHPDLVVEDVHGRIEAFAGNGDGMFGASSLGGTTSVDSSMGDGGHLIAAADLNGDGALDLLTYNPGLGVSVELGMKSGNYSLEGTYTAGTGTHSQFAVADFNGDGALDVAMDAPGGVEILYGMKAAAATPGVVSGAPSPAAFEGAYSLVAKMNGAQTSGTVDFTVDGNAAGSAPVVNGVATLAVAADPGSANGKPLLPGTHALGGTYFASASALAAELTGGTLVVSLAPSTVTLTPAPPTVTLGPTYFYGQGVNGYVHFNVIDPSNYPATGTWTQLSNGVAVPDCVDLSAANASSYCPYGYPTLLDAGSYVFTEAYNGGPASGDPVNASSVSAPYGFTVMPDVTTVAGLISSVNPAAVGTPVTFTATLTGNAAVPTGTVEFLDGGGAIGTGVLDGNGVATLTTSTLALGTHPISVRYAATLDFGAAASGVLSEKIVPVVSNLASAVVLQSSLNPSAQGQSVTFTATVSVPGPFVNLVNSGTVQFLDGTAVIGSGTINATGRAVFSTAALAVGSHPITASYAGLLGTSQTILPSVSAVLKQVVGMTLPVEPKGFVVTVTPDPVRVRPGQTVYLTVDVRAVSGFAEAVTLSCGKLPHETKCTFAEGTIPVGGGATTLAFATTAPHACGSDKGYDGTPVACALPAPETTGRGVVAGVLFGGVMMLAGFRRRRSLRLIGLVLVLVGFVGLNGCGGNCTNLGTEPGSYAVVVTGTAADGSAESVSLPIMVSLEP